MKAIVKEVRKETLPRYSDHTGQDEATLMVVADVDFYNDAGEVVHSQSYAHLPEDVDAEYYQRQADAMQADLVHAVEQQKVVEANSAADEKVDQLRRHHHLDFGDKLPITHRR